MGSVGNNKSVASHSQLGPKGIDVNSNRDLMKIVNLANSVNPNYSTGKKEWRENCALCAVSGILNMMGYDTEAMPRDKKWRGFDDVFDFDWNNTDNFIAPAARINYSGTDYMASYNNPNKFGRSLTGTIDKIDEAMQNWGEGSYAIVNLKWSGKIINGKRKRGAHTAVVYNDGGTTTLIDFQTHKIYTGKNQIFDYMQYASPSSTGLYRVDNTTVKSNIKDLDKIVKVKGGNKK